jgi:hypothetical protein
MKWRRKKESLPVQYILSLDQGDIYSFAIILHEIAARAGTWGLSGGQLLEPKEIVMRIRSRLLQVTLTNAIGCNSINILVKGRWKK